MSTLGSFVPLTMFVIWCILLQPNVRYLYKNYLATTHSSKINATHYLGSNGLSRQVWSLNKLFSLQLIQRWQSIKVHGLAKVIQNESKTFICFSILVTGQRQDDGRPASNKLHRLLARIFEHSIFFVIIYPVYFPSLCCNPILMYFPTKSFPVS